MFGLTDTRKSEKFNKERKHSQLKRSEGQALPSPSGPGSGPGSLPGHQEHESSHDSAAALLKALILTPSPTRQRCLYQARKQPKTREWASQTAGGEARLKLRAKHTFFLKLTTLRGRTETGSRRNTEGAAGPLPKSRTPGPQPQGCTASAWCSRSRQGSPSSDPPTSWPRQEGGRPSPGLCC